MKKSTTIVLFMLAVLGFIIGGYYTLNLIQIQKSISENPQIHYENKSNEIYRTLSYPKDNFTTITIYKGHILNMTSDNETIVIKVEN